MTLRATFSVLACCLVASSAVHAQMGRTSDWWTFAGDAQRSGWERNEQKFTKDDVKNFQFLWNMELPHAGKGPHALAPPVIFGNLIGSRGFKELAFVQSSSGDIWAIDADLARLYWHQKPDAQASKSSCPAMASVPNLPAPVVFRLNRPAAPAAPERPATPPPANPLPAPGTPPKPATPPPTNPAFRVRPVYMLSGDGKLHQLNIDDATPLRPAFDFLPAGAQTLALNVSENVLYAVTRSCDGKTPDAVRALDVTPTQLQPVAYESPGAPLQLFGAPAIGANGNIYVQSANSLLALSPKELKPKDNISLSAAMAAPVLFTYKGKELVVAADKEGRLNLLDAAALGGDDHKTPLFRTEPLVTWSTKSVSGLYGGISTWEQPDGTRYVLATVWGPLASGFHVPQQNGDISNGAVVSFKLQDDGGKLSLAAVWASPDLLSPDPPVIAQNTVFVLSNGKYKHKLRKVHGVPMMQDAADSSSPARLYALDGATGQTVWSSGDKVTAPGSLSGLSIANSRLYFTTVDNRLYVFGKYLETEQH